MNPRQYEELVRKFFTNQGYLTQITNYVNDFGVDVFATKGKEKIAVQVKLYGQGRKVNRQMLMELHGAKDYFDCTKAIMVTDGAFLQDAIEVAKKLKIEILNIDKMLFVETDDYIIDDEKSFEKYGVIM